MCLMRKNYKKISKYLKLFVLYGNIGFWIKLYWMPQSVKNTQFINKAEKADF